MTEKIQQFTFEDIIGRDFFCSVKREGSPTLVNEYECVGCGTIRNLIRDIDINEPVYCKPCLIKKEDNTE